MTRYRARVADSLAQRIRPLGPLETFLDFGAGDGEMLRSICDRVDTIGVARAVDVQIRPSARTTVELYDGVRLPFEDRAFTAAMAVDVLHHAPDPTAALRELVRVVDRYLIIKDHTYKNVIGFSVLAALDVKGNKRFGVPSRFRYQRGWEWDATLREAGFSMVGRDHPLTCHTGALAVTNRLQYLAVYERCGDVPPDHPTNAAHG